MLEVRGSSLSSSSGYTSLLQDLHWILSIVLGDRRVDLYLLKDS